MKPTLQCILSIRKKILPLTQQELRRLEYKLAVVLLSHHFLWPLFGFIEQPLMLQTSSAVSPLQTFPPKLVLLDFGDTDSMPEAIAEILDCYGCLDIIIFNSSMKVKAPAQTVSLEVDKLLMDNNYFGPVTLAKGRWWEHVQLWPSKGETMKAEFLFQACWPPWSPGEVVTCCWLTASKGD